jgi:hypothetical protein
VPRSAGLCETNPHYRVNDSEVRNRARNLKMIFLLTVGHARHLCIVCVYSTLDRNGLALLGDS